MEAREGSGCTASCTSFEEAVRGSPPGSSYATVPVLRTTVPAAVICATETFATVRLAANNNETLKHAFTRALNAPKAR
jgi:hypothetical protein